MGMLRRASRAIAIMTGVCALLLMATAAAAQTSDATLLGRVVDEQGGIIPGAAVTATNINTGRARTVITDGAGRFRLAALTPGSYRLEVVLSGFATTVRSGLNLATSQEATIDLTLKVASATETVDVKAEAPLVNLSSIQINTVVNNEQLNALPILGRDFSSLAALAPGIAAVGSGTLSAGGQAAANNNFLLDGINNKAPNLGGTRGAVSLEGVQEFVVIANQFAAEYGQASGAVVSAVTRSGTNTTQGRAFFFHRDERLNWKNPYVPGDITPFSEQRYGAYIGGPIVLNKAHYFVTNEALRTRTTSLITAVGVPDADRNYPNPFDQMQPLAKVDVRLTGDQAVWFRYRLDRSYETGVGIGGLNTESQGNTRKLSNQDFAAAHTWVLGARVLNELRVNAGYRYLLLDPTGYSDPLKPQISRPSSVTGGDSGGRQLTRAPSGYITENLSITTGEHSFKIGAEIQKYGGSLDSCPNGRGTFTFATDAPFNPAVTSTYPTRYTITQAPDFPTCHVPLPNTGYVAFAQDSWRVRSNLTLSLGVRYDTDNAWKEVTGLKIDDRANLVPRLGAVWDPFKTGKTAIRGGYGIYIDQGLLNTPLTVQRGIIWKNVTITNPGYPDPYSRVGSVVAPTQTVVAKNLRTAETRSTTLGVKREIAKGISVSVDGVHTDGFNLSYGVDLNAPVNGKRPDPTKATVTEIRSGARSFYKSLLLGVDVKRSGIQFGASYTLAKATSYSEGRTSLPSDGVNIANDLGPTNNDRRHQLVSHVTWLAPLGIQVAAVFQARSGLPINITTGIDNNADGQTTDRPDLVVSGGNPFALATYSSAFTGRVGNLSRNAVRGPKFSTLDLRLSKIFRISKYKIEAFGEAYNLLNKVNRNSPSGNMRNSAFGQSTNIVGNMRQVEIGIRFDFGVRRP